MTICVFCMQAVFLFTVYCKPIVSQSVSEMVDKIKTLPKSSTIYILSPIVRGRKGEYKKEILNFKKEDFKKLKLMEILQY